MKAKDLRIGNLVNLPNGKDTVVITGIHELYCFGRYINATGTFRIEQVELMGVLLTEEWLLRFGFELEIKTTFNGNFRVYTLNDFTYNSNHDAFWIRNVHKFKQPEYVHELQNLYYAWTGKELEVKP